jgi:hypothetical protein
MNRKQMLATLLLAVAPSVIVQAQVASDHVALVYSTKARSLNVGQLETALKKHFAWHREHKDNFTWYIWQVTSGENIGDFVVGTFGHDWKEFDARAKFDEADDADFIPNVLPTVEKVDLGYWAFLPEASHPSPSPQPAAMSQITHYFVKPDGFVAFVDALKEMKTAFDKGDVPMYINWYRLVSGGEGPQFVVAIDRNSWTEMAQPAKSLDQILAEALGPQRAISVLTAIRQATRFTRSYMLSYRADLSYIAPK